MDNERTRKLAGLLSEATIPNFEKKLKEIASMTDGNDHIGAYIEGAKLLKNKKLENIFTGMQMIQDAEGELPNWMKDARYQYYSAMMKFAESKLSKEDYEKFHDCF